MRWPEALLSFALVVAAVINLMPLPGLWSVAHMESLYGIPVREPTLELLLRHRALLFGLIGLLMLAGAFHRPLQLAAILAALGSMVGFMVLAAQSPELAAPLRRVALADLIATLLLLVALALRAWVSTGETA